MARHRFLTPLLIVAYIGVGHFVADAQGQQDRSERIVESGFVDTIVVLNDLDVVSDDIERLADDFGFGFIKSTVKSSLRTGRSGLSREAGLFVYFADQMQSSIVQFEIEDREKMAQLFKPELKEEIEDGQWRQLNPDATIPVDDWFSLDCGVMAKRQFFVGPDDQEDACQKLSEGKPLALKMDDVSHDIINKSGVCVIGDNGNMKPPEYYLERLKNDAAYGALTEAEWEWLSDLVKRTRKVEFGLVGLKYHADQLFEIRVQAMLEKGETLGGLYNLERSEETWIPDLGFEKSQLVASASIKLDAFDSSAAPKVIPKVLANELSTGNSLTFLRGNSLGLLMNLVGDSWNDLSAARIAIYENDKDENAGMYGLVAVADAKDPAAVLEELKKISRLTKPVDKNRAAEFEAARLAEVRRLIQELSSTDDAIAGRAESRLFITRELGVKELKKTRETLPKNAQARADRIIKYGVREIEKQKKRSKVQDPDFWTNLNPGLVLKENTGELAGFPMHTIFISPDSTKSVEEIAQATQVMGMLFGPKWNEIPVVQVGDHFVFMIGSDEPMLKRIVKNVDQRLSLLKVYFDGVGFSPQTGELQVFTNAVRLNKLMGTTQKTFFGQDEKDSLDEDVCWVGVKMHKQSITIDALVPMQQVRPFTRAGF